jgi:diaminopimelate epimerase
MNRVSFRKMHGLGNDFVVLDRRFGRPPAIANSGARALADRHTGIGCDQLILIEPPRNPAAQVLIRFFNADGSEGEACGNGTRCVARLIGEETGRDQVAIETAAGLLVAELLPDRRVAVDMGEVRLGWQEIPLARAMDTLHVDLALGPLAEPVCTNIGNPHATFFVADAEAIDLGALGPPLEHHALFPQRANIGIATVRDRATIRLRVWERGAGLTRACGSGACAALVSAARRGLAGRRATVILDGGSLEIAWRSDNHVTMTGPAALSFEGSFDAALLTG